MPTFPPLTRRRRGRPRPLLVDRWGGGRWRGGRWGPGVVRVAGSSMLPTLAAGDACLVWWSARTRPRAGRVVVARLPARPGVLAVKRVLGCWDGGCWLEGDNLAASTDSWRVGAVAADDVLAWVLVRYWPRPGWLASRARRRSGGVGQSRFGGVGHRRSGGVGQSRAASDSSSAR